jgi:hypothetical protein
MSAPVKGTMLTSGVVDWLRKFDTSKGGSRTKEELEKEFFKQVKLYSYKQKEKKYKQQQEFKYGYSDAFNTFAVEREQISVPICVGVNKDTHKKVFLTKKRPKNVKTPELSGHS